MWANLVNIAMNTQAVGVESMYGRSIMASFHGLWSLAGFCGAAIGNFFVGDDISTLLHFILIALAAIIMVLVSYRNTLPDNGYKQSSAPLFVKPDKAVLLLGFIAFCSMVCEGAMADWSGVYFQNVIHSPAAYKTLGYVAFAGTMATGRFAGDKLITKFGVKRILQFSGVLISSGLLIVILLPYLSSAIAGCLLVGFGASCVVPMVYAIAGKSKTMSPGLALAAVSTISFVGFLIGPPLIGFVAQLTGLKISFAIIAVLGLGVSFFGNKISE
jgi:fucose permease